MKAIVVGMGIQGKKRKKFLGKDFVFSVDKYSKGNFNSIYKVPLNSFDTVYICTPDDNKIKIVNYCIDNNKNVLVEKPFLTNNNALLYNLKKKTKIKKLVCYTAYNHRFEPVIQKLKTIIKSKKLGRIYNCRLFYGNGTSLNVKKSIWRDKKLGVITDLGSHLLDICIYLFGKNINIKKIIDINKFENKAPDHATIFLEINKIKIELEMTLCMWKNTFKIDLLASKGSAHVDCLGKWGKNTLIYRKRKLPSGVPLQKKYTFKKGDVTWKRENLFFKKLIKYKSRNSFDKDLLINKCFLNILNLYSNVK